MFSDPKSVDMYAKKIHKPVELIKESIKRFHPKSALQTDHFADLDGTVRDAVKLKFLTQPLTMEQLAELIQIPPEKK